jgi:hypothetical protein
VLPKRSGSCPTKSEKAATYDGGMRLVRLGVLAALGLLVAAAPAGAATPVLGTAMYPWFYWAAPILALSGVALILMLWGGYIMKVLFPKYRGRKVKE